MPGPRERPPATTAGGDARAVLFDLGGTLLEGERAAEHAADALDVIAGLAPPAGPSVSMALVSDFTMPAPGAADSEIDALVAEYVAIVRGAGLARYFEPLEQKVTLSTQAGVVKPHPAIFRLALQRLGLPPDFHAALFITEDAAHVDACKALGLQALRFGSGGEVRTCARGPPAPGRRGAVQPTAAFTRSRRQPSRRRPHRPSGRRRAGQCPGRVHSRRGRRARVRKGARCADGREGGARALRRHVEG
jgi:hypothetical protein